MAKPISSTYLQPGIGGARMGDHRRTLYRRSYAGSAKTSTVYELSIIHNIYLKDLNFACHSVVIFWVTFLLRSVLLHCTTVKQFVNVDRIVVHIRSYCSPFR